jgi:hypothetical protein
MYVLHSIFLIDTGVISTTKKVKIQLLAEARDAAGVRIVNGAYSAGTGSVSETVVILSGIEDNLHNHGIASNPTAKKKLKRKSITVATYPADFVPFATVPAKIAIQAH